MSEFLALVLAIACSGAVGFGALGIALTPLLRAYVAEMNAIDARLRELNETRRAQEAAEDGT